MITSLWFWIALLNGLALYWGLPRFRDWTLVIVSAAFIAFMDVRSIIGVTVLSIACFYVGRRAATMPKWKVGVFVVGVLSFLIYYKYIPGLIAAFSSHKAASAAAVTVAEVSSTVPLGASYFTFKLVHYVVDARRRQHSNHSLATFLSYIFFLPMFAAGPIERFDDYLVNRSPKLEPSQLAQGGSRIIYGLIKKMVLVDLLLAKQAPKLGAHVYDAIPFVYAPCSVSELLSKHPVSPIFVWQFVIHQFTTWYLDFSAYSDIAIGAGLLFGIRLVENFDWPLFAPDPTSFWKRYHMSLSAFCQRYVYLPVMGRTRNPYAAVYATMMIMGLWHAGNLNFLAWGVYHATVLSIHLTWGRIKRAKKWKLKHPGWKVPATILTALAICASAAFPSTQARGIGDAFRLFGMLFGIHH